MLPDLDLLLKLQVIDYDLGELERSKEYLPDMMENLRREISEAREKAETTEKELQQARLEEKNLELHMSAKEQELQKFQQQMMSIKTNKEYDALVAQIDAVKTDISDTESTLLATMDKVADYESELPQQQSQLAQIDENNTNQLGILQEKIDSIGEKVSEKMTEREQIITTITRPTRAVYERVRRGKGGAAVVVVKRRACSACHKALTPKKVQEIKRGDRIHTCESCGRLLFWDEEVSN